MAIISTIQNSFAAGEISPSLFGRTDLKKYHSGASTMRNFYVNYRGGSSSRAGTAYVGTCKQPGTAAPPRDIPFQFNIAQGYALEFGDQYMRIKSNGAYLLEAATTITAITQANPGVVSSVGHGYLNGDWVFLAIAGMTQLNGLTFIVTNRTANTYQLTDLFGTLVNTTTYSAFTSGTAKRVYTVVAPYAAIDLPYLKYTQSADTMSLVCVNQQTQTEYPPYELVRNGLTNWVFTQTSFASSISAPTNVAATAQASTTLSTYYSYVVTAVDAVTGDESIASLAVSIQNNDISINAGSNTITWSPVANASSYNVYKAVPAYQTQVPTGTSYGFAGSCFGTTFVDTNITADFTITPPLHSDPFSRGAITAVNVVSGGTNLTQDGVGYFVTTGTGSGFSGTPVVVNGALSSFIIYNGGTGYIGSNTITITQKAHGTYTFTTNPADNNTVIMNGVSFRFKNSPTLVNDVQRGSSASESVANFVTSLNASVNAAITPATYSKQSDLVLYILYDTAGPAGNAYTIASGTYGGGTPSGPTLVGGSNSAATVSITVGAASGTYPSVVAYFQQRRGYANTLNQPDTYFFSQPGSFENFDSSIPSVDDDAVIGAPWAQQINGIQFMQPMPKGLVILTGNGAWLLNGGAASQPLTPSSQQVTAEAYNGCNSTIPPILINYDIMYVQSKGSIIRSLAYNFYMDVYTGEDKTVLANHLFDYYQIKQWAWAEEPAKVAWVVRSDGTMLSLTFLKEQDIYGFGRHDTNGSFVGVCSIVEPPIDAVYLIVKRRVSGQWKYYSERMDNRNWKTAEDSFCVDSGLSYPLVFPNATLTPAAAYGTDNISSVIVINGGSGYTAPVVTAVDPEGQGTGATFSAVVSLGVITAINVVTEGQDYVPGSVQLVITDTTGSGAIAQAVITNNVNFFSSSGVFAVGDVGSVIRIGNNNFNDANTGVAPSGSGKAIITSYVSPTQVVANIIEDITAILTDDPGDTPIPAIPNTWSMTAPVASVRGLNHLEGKLVAIVADGSVQPSQTVVNGMITLPRAYSSITIGLPFICQLQTMYLDVDTQGTIQGQRKNIGSVVVRMEGTRGLQVGTNQVDQSTLPNNRIPVWRDMKEIKERNALVNAGSAIPLFTGDHYINVPSNWDTHGQIAVQQIYPLPANVLAVVTQFVNGDTEQ